MHAIHGNSLIKQKEAPLLFLSEQTLPFCIFEHDTDSFKTKESKCFY